MYIACVSDREQIAYFKDVIRQEDIASMNLTSLGIIYFENSNNNNISECSGP